MNTGYIDCFKTQFKYWMFLGIYPGEINHYYKYYSCAFLSIIIILYDFLYTLNFYFMPREIGTFVDEMLFYFTEVSVFSKAFTFILSGKDIAKIIDSFNSEIFRPNDAESKKILDDAKAFIQKYRKLLKGVSMIGNIAHVVIPFLMHLFYGIPLILPVCSYSFLSDETIERFIYPLYIYQSVGMHFHIYYNVYFDSFFLGLMILSIAQLKILDGMLRNVTSYKEATVEPIHVSVRERSFELALNKCIIRYDQISKFCSMIQDVFSVTLFVQFTMASCIICLCLVRFTMPAVFVYYLFLSSYFTMMTFQIMVPCWFGTEIVVASTSLSTAVYSCDWTPRSRRFKSSMRLFAERTQKPLSITGGKMFSLSLKTFTSIMNSAYSFFTLLRNMQSQDL